MSTTLRHLQILVEVGDGVTSDDVLARNEANGRMETDFSDRHDAMMSSWLEEHKAASAACFHSVSMQRFSLRQASRLLIFFFFALQELDS